VFYDATGGNHYVIDFDDAVYHWFVLDIDQAIDSLNGRIPEAGREMAKDVFIKGYQSVMPVDGAMLEVMPVCRRYANLYGYVRILRAVREMWANEPDWMLKLRDRLSQAMAKRRRDFGKPV
jgi:Ser/Thr protein kinase RdoA (MazF antagonist)